MVCRLSAVADVFFDADVNIFRVGQFRIISHYNAALFTARRDEMCSIVELTFRYLADRPQVHSDVSGLPFMVRRYFYSCF